MGRERQKRKNRSSIPKVRPKRKARRLNPKGNPLVAANWDQSLTLAQNYRRLGLTSKLNARTGGIEKKISEIPDSNNLLPNQKQDPLAITSQATHSTVPSEVRVERDPETGAIVQITDPTWETSHNPLNDPLNDILDKEYDNSNVNDSEEPNDIVQELAKQASVEVKKKLRHQSRREEAWVESIVREYGEDCEDYERVAMDKKLNPQQQSAGDIRRRVKKWKESR